MAINVRASGAWKETFAGAGWTPVMPELALDEVLHVFDANGERQEVPLRHLASKREVEVLSLSVDEQQSTIQLAAELGPGEAACIAVGSHRRLAVATDDGLARAKARLIDPALELVRTEELFQACEARRGVAPDDIATLLKRIEQRARFRPGSGSEAGRWWHTRSGYER